MARDLVSTKKWSACTNFSNYCPPFSADTSYSLIEMSSISGFITAAVSGMVFVLQKGVGKDEKALVQKT